MDTGGMRVSRSLTFNDVLIRPQQTPVSSRDEVSLGTRFTRSVPLDIPIVSANMSSVTEVEMANAMRECGGLGVLHRFLSIGVRGNQLSKMAYPRTAAIGLSKEGISDPDVLVLDVAHAHSTRVVDIIDDLQLITDKGIMVGNIATAEAAEDLIQAGADGLKVGIGPSPVCKTRDVTGAGVGQLTAIHEVAQVAHDHGIPVCADGGMKSSGDIVKALAAGADTVMLGRLLAGADESPAQAYNGHKLYHGSASEYEKDSERYIEGTAEWVECSGPVRNTIDKLCDGIRSGISYGGGRNIQEMQERAHFEALN